MFELGGSLWDPDNFMSWRRGGSRKIQGLSFSLLSKAAGAEGLTGKVAAMVSIEEGQDR